MSVDVCLVSPPQRAYNHNRPPLALMLLASYLLENRVSVEIADPKSEIAISGEVKNNIVNQILKQIENGKPRIVGISCYTPEYNDVISLARRIKEFDRNIKIIVGGVHATLRSQDFFFNDSPVDFVVIGEGELTLFELAQAILKGDKDFRNIYGIGYYDEEKNEYVQTEERPLIHDLDALPFPAYDKVDMKYYTAPNPYAVRGLFLSSFYILVGRGCPAQCTFCVSAELRKTVAPGKSLRCRSAKNVVDEIELLKKRYYIDAFYFIDDNFTLRKDLVSDICDELINRKLHLIWSCSARINTLSEELLMKMKEAGCVQVDLGVESGSDVVLKRLRKGITVKQIKEIFKICHKIGMRTFANILVNIPEESEEEVNETLQLLDEIRPSVTSFNIFIPYLGTEIYNQQNVNLSPAEYDVLGEPPLQLVKNPRFRYAQHKIDFERFYITNHKKYNSMFTFLPDYFSLYYLRLLLKSHKKKDYIFGIKDLAKEYIKQAQLLK